MIRKLDSLIPEFLKDIDKRLLLNYPALWATKLHYVVFFTVIGLGLLIGHVWLRGISPANIPDVELHFGLMFLPAIVTYLMWSYRVSMFNVEKDFGIIMPLQPVVMFFVYLFCVGAMASVPFLYGNALSHRIANAVPTEELAQDINTLNLGYKYFQGADRNEYKDYRHNKFYTQYYGMEGVWKHEEWIGISNADYDKSVRIKRVNDFIKTYNKYASPEHDIHFNAQTLVKQYDNYENGYDLLDYSAEYVVQSNIRAISNSKNRRYLFSMDYTPEFFWVMVYALGLLTFLFVSTSLRKMLIAIIVGFVGFVTAGFAFALADDILHLRHEEVYVAMMFFVAYIALLAQTGWQRNTKQVSLWKSVSMILTAMMTPLVPIFGLMLTHDAFDHYHFDESFAIPMMVYGSILLSMLSLVVFFIPKFRQAEAEPVQN